eukprot:COSAG06_NODE_7559_length_2459_cov_6.489831_4_plen_59_part_01
MINARERRRGGASARARPRGGETRTRTPQQQPSSSPVSMATTYKAVVIGCSRMGAFIDN